MHNISHESTNWMDVEDLFFNKVLKKEEREISHRAAALLREDLYRDGVDLHKSRREISDYQEAIFNAPRSMIRFKNPQRLIKMIDKIKNEKVGVTHSAVL